MLLAGIRSPWLEIARMCSTVAGITNAASSNRPAEPAWPVASRPAVSPCTAGSPADRMAAAAGPALRVGSWRGSWITVSAGGRSVRVQLVDVCQCYGTRLLDLYAGAFAQLAPLGRGLVVVEVTA